MKKVFLLFATLCMCLMVGCFSSDVTSENISEVNTPEEESADDKVLVLGENIQIADLSEEDEGKTFSFVANYWSEVIGEYNYHFSYYEEGQEYAFSFNVKDETTDKDLSFLVQHDYKDNLAVQMTAVFDGIEYGEKQNFYMFTVKEAVQVENNPAEQRVNDDRYRVGDTVTLTNGTSSFTMTILAANIYTEKGEDFLQIEVEVDNIGTETIYLGNGDMEFYGDDYLIEHDYTLPLDATVINAEVAPGRKAKGGFYRHCNNHDSYGVIEGQFSDVIIVIKDENSQTNTGNNSLENDIVVEDTTSKDDYVAEAYTEAFSNAYGDSLLYMSEYGKVSSDGSLGEVTIYFNGVLTVQAPYYLETSGTSGLEHYGYDEVYYFYDDDIIGYLGLSFAGEGVVVEYYLSNSYVDSYSVCSG